MPRRWRASPEALAEQVCVVGAPLCVPVATLRDLRILSSPRLRVRCRRLQPRPSPRGGQRQGAPPPVRPAPSRGVPCQYAVVIAISDALRSRVHLLDAPTPLSGLTLTRFPLAGLRGGRRSSRPRAGSKNCGADWGGMSDSRPPEMLLRDSRDAVLRRFERAREGHPGLHVVRSLESSW